MGVERQMTANELAADLPAALEQVKSGEVLTIVEDGRPVATVRGADEEPWLIRHDPALRLSDFKAGAPPGFDLDGVEMLIAERDFERSGKKYS
jgi:antitoxin (DNA-binding transcriptional repressor) of toxin-antitoxin stability system